MDKRVLRPTLCALTIGVVLIFAGCGGQSGTATVTSVSITPTSANVIINGTETFSATVNVQSGTASTSTVVTWQVNGVTGGNSTVGTIVASSTDEQVATYTAPAVVPTTNNGQVNVTAVVPTTSGSSSTVTSNTAVVTVGVVLGMSVTPSTTTVPAGANFQFSAILNSVIDHNAIWSVSSTNGGDIGTIDPQTGLYTAPPYPPPGGTLTVMAQDGASSATATVTIVYSDHSLTGPFAFSYTGSDASGFLAAAGSFVSDGDGHITSGVEDVESFLTGISTQVALSGTYKVGPDGRGTASITTTHGASTWQFVLTTNQHAFLTRFDANAAGGGTMDQQNLNALAVSDSVVCAAASVPCPFVFGAVGTDAGYVPLAVAGKFSTDDAGNIPSGSNIADVNDGGTITTGDTTLNGSYSLDAAFPGTGRGTITLTSTATGTLEYAFYLIDNTHLHLVEIDSKAYLAGDVFSGAAPSAGFSNASLPAGNYVFADGGTSLGATPGAFAAAGVFTSDGNGNITGGALDSNNAGTVQTDATLHACTYAVDATTGRIALALTAGGSCPAMPNFVMYQTAQGSAVMMELDSTAVAAGAVYPQTSTAALTGSLALGLVGQGAFHNSPGSAQGDVTGQITVSSGSVTSGNLDINNFSAVFAADPITTTGTSMGTPGTNGRGTLVLAVSNPAATYNLVYYLIDTKTAVLFDQDTTRIAVGALALQF